jgi:hypothetical protein
MLIFPYSSLRHDQGERAHTSDRLGSTNKSRGIACPTRMHPEPMAPANDCFYESWAWVTICLICLLIGTCCCRPLALCSLSAKKYANLGPHLYIPYSLLM